MPAESPQLEHPVCGALPTDLDLRLVSRRPARLTDETLRKVNELPIPVTTAAIGSAGVESPAASIIVITYNNLPFTKMCLASLLLNTEFPAHEVIVVDNGSTDGTPDYLHEVAAANPHVRLILNGENRGFAAANNQGLAVSRGDVIVLLNNDTILPPGWLAGLTRHLPAAESGLVGPATNRIINEAQVATSYTTYGEYLDLAGERARALHGLSFEIPMLAMFCLVMRRAVFERIGPLDEQFAVGMFEDDDYALRAKAAGFRLMCADDVIVHHFGEASFGELAPTGEFSATFSANRLRFEAKWGVRWQPHGRRNDDNYVTLKRRVREMVCRVAPVGATVAVVSKGDEDLLHVHGRTGWHFPQRSAGTYAGHHPPDGAAAVDHLEELRARGADFLLLPAPSLWWLDHYASFRQHLFTRYRVVAHEPQVGITFDLSITDSVPIGVPISGGEPPTERQDPARRELEQARSELAGLQRRHEWLASELAVERRARQMLEASVSADYHASIRRSIDVATSVIPRGAVTLVVSRGDERAIDLPGVRAAHFPQGIDGAYAGCYPADDAAAIEHLESLVARGAEFLVFPNSAFWWLQHYRGLNEHLEHMHVRVWADDGCMIFKLRTSKEPSPHLSPVARRTASIRSPESGSRVELRTPRQRHDVVCFPIIRWDFRFQRPQQLMLRFAAAGHRVFYLAPEFRTAGDPFQTREVRPDVIEVSLRAPRLNIYRNALDDWTLNTLYDALAELRDARAIDCAAAIVQLPFWWALAQRCSAAYDWPVVYDRMDYLAGFSTSHELSIELERELLSGAHLVVASSASLAADAARYNKHVLLVRNGCDFDHFSKVRSSRNTARRPVIGYFGAIAEWFDTDLVSELADSRPDWDFVLVGSTFGADVSRLAAQPNVTLAGERPYGEIPEWLAKFDVTVLPFRRTPLTEATNPVKAYEIFAAGKPLVSVPLPEMVELAPLARLAGTAAEFEREIVAELTRPDAEAEAARRAFARENSWQKRFDSFAPAIDRLVRQERPGGGPEAATGTTERDAGSSG